MLYKSLIPLESSMFIISKIFFNVKELHESQMCLDTKFFLNTNFLYAFRYNNNGISDVI